MDDVAREVTDLTQGRSGQLRVGAGPGSGEHLLATACSVLLKDSPKVTLTVTVATPGVLVPVLRNGELDLIVTGIPMSHHEELVQERLCDDEFIVYASVNHRLAKLKQVTLTDLAQERWVMSATSAVAPQWLHRAFHDGGLPSPRVVMQTTSIKIRHHLVASCEVVGLSTREVVRQGAPRYRFAELRVKGLTYSRSLDVSYRKDAYLPPAARRLIELLKTTAKEIANEARSKV